MASRNVIMRDPDGTIVGEWSRAAWDRMQQAMRENDRATAVALYASGGAALPGDSAN